MPDLYLPASPRPKPDEPGFPSGPMQNRIEYDDKGKLDEVVTNGGAHLERMGKRSWFLNCIREDGSSFAVWIDGKVTLTEERPVVKRLSMATRSIRPKPDEPISSIDLERREAQKERTAMHMAAVLEREKMRRRDLVRWFTGEAE